MRMMVAASTLMMMRLSTAGIIVAPPCESTAYFLGPLKDSSPKKMLLAKGKIPRPVKDSYQKKCCSQKEKIEINFRG